MVMDRLARDPAMHVYHYGGYESGAMKRLMQRHATREDEVDSILRGKVLVNLYDHVVRSGIRASVESYSIKQIEKFYLAGARGSGHEAGFSVVEYETLDGVAGRSRSSRPSRTTTGTTACRRSDLRDWLEDRRVEAAPLYPDGIVPRPGPGEPAPPETVTAKRAETRAREDALRAGIPADRRIGPTRRRVAGCWQLCWTGTTARRSRSGGTSTDWSRHRRKTTWPMGRRLAILSSSRTLGPSSCPAFTDTASTRRRSSSSSRAIPRSILPPAGERGLDPRDRCGDRHHRSQANRRRPSALTDPGQAEELRADARLAAPAGRWRHCRGNRGARAIARCARAHPPPPAPDHRRSRDRPAGWNVGGAARRGDPHRAESRWHHPGYSGAAGNRQDLDGSTDDPGARRRRATRRRHRPITQGHQQPARGNRQSGPRGGPGGPHRTARRCRGRTGDDRRPRRPRRPRRSPGRDPGGHRRCARGHGMDVGETRCSRRGRRPVRRRSRPGLAGDASAVAATADSIVLLGDPNQLPQVSNGVHPDGAATSALEHLVGDGRRSARTRPVPGTSRIDSIRTSTRTSPTRSTTVGWRQTQRRRSRYWRMGRRSVASGSGSCRSSMPVPATDHARRRTGSRRRSSPWIGRAWTDRNGPSAAFTVHDVLVVAPYNAQVAEIRTAVDQRIGVHRTSAPWTSSRAARLRSRSTR